jgi:pyridoxal/pyridoxine/pyridoxamine kinase
VGSGDLFSALLLTWLDETQWNVRAAIRATIASMQAVLKRTAERANAGFVKENPN